jgi:ketosteroid isomerase-like protein
LTPSAGKRSLRKERENMARSDADRLNDTMVAGLAQGDAGVVASVYGPDARLLPPGMDVQTDADIERYWQGAIDAGVRHARIETVSYEEHDDGLAVEEGRWELRASAGTPIVDAGKFLIVHKRQGDGSWKYAFDMFNSSLAATE